MAWNYWINLIKEEVLHIGIRKEEKADIDMEPCFFRNTWVKWLWSQKCRSAAICCNSMVPETRSCLDVSMRSLVRYSMMVWPVSFLKRRLR